MNPAKRIDDDPYPFVSRVCDLFDTAVTQSDQFCWVGGDNDPKTPRLPNMPKLDTYCEENMAQLETDAEPAAEKDDNWGLPPEAQSVADFLPHPPGLYTVKGDQFILDRNGVKIGHVEQSKQSAAHAALFAASWELLVMLHQ